MFRPQSTGHTGQGWVQWIEVNQFTFSEPSSRHYVLDHATGTIVFGDGRYGMVPPAGIDNIVARYYTSGGGPQGNVAAGKLTGLQRAIPGIAWVTNPMAATGGIQSEAVDSAFLTRSAQRLKNLDRAVTLEDLQWLAMAASPRILQATSFLTPTQPSQADTIWVAILPRSEADQPYPDVELLHTVRQHLQTRVLLTIRDRIHVIGPNYQAIDVTGSIRLRPTAVWHIVKPQLTTALKQFFQPKTGGPERQGWAFQQPVEAWQVRALLEGIDDIMSVASLRLNDGRSDTVPMRNADLPCPGIIRIQPQTISTHIGASTL